MEQQKLYSLSPNEDVTIINLRSKLLILENTYTAKLHTKILRFGSLSQEDLIYCAWTF